MNNTEYNEPPGRLAWELWLSCGLNICFICAGTGTLSLRYPEFFVGWLLVNVALAVWRLVWQPMWDIERRLLKLFAWLSPLLLLGAGTPTGEIIFRDADTTIRQYRTESFFGGGPDEEQLVTVHYRTRYGLYEEETGQQEATQAGSHR
jgi:hypothetical protein